MNAPWQPSVLGGLVIGTATGSVALVFGAIVANRWFVARRRLVVGILGAAWATGALVFLPLLAALVDAFGCRASLAVIDAGPRGTDHDNGEAWIQGTRARELTVVLVAVALARTGPAPSSRR